MPCQENVNKLKVTWRKSLIKVLLTPSTANTSSKRRSTDDSSNYYNIWFNNKLQAEFFLHLRCLIFLPIILPYCVGYFYDFYESIQSNGFL